VVTARRRSAPADSVRRAARPAGAARRARTPASRPVPAPPRSCVMAETGSCPQGYAERPRSRLAPWRGRRRPIESGWRSSWGAVAGDRPRSGPAARARARSLPVGARVGGPAGLHPGGAFRGLRRRPSGPPGMHRGCALLRELGRRRRDPLPEWRPSARPGFRALRGPALPRPSVRGRPAAARACPPGRQAAGRRPEAVRARGGEPLRGRTAARPGPSPARRGRAFPCRHAHTVTSNHRIGRTGPSWRGLVQPSEARRASWDRPAATGRRADRSRGRARALRASARATAGPR
jgi:hypothetical protein